MYTVQRWVTTFFGVGKMADPVNDTMTSKRTFVSLEAAMAGALDDENKYRDPGDKLTAFDWDGLVREECEDNDLGIAWTQFVDHDMEQGWLFTRVDIEVDA